jgi:hypothetical protein
MDESNSRPPSVPPQPAGDARHGTARDGDAIEPPVLSEEPARTQPVSDAMLKDPVPTGAPQAPCSVKAMPNWAWALIVVVVAVFYYVARTHR